MRANKQVLDIINSENIAKAILKIDEINDSEILKQIILLDIENQTVQLRALMRLYKELLDNSSYLNLISQLIYLCYSTDNFLLRTNIIKFLDHPTVLYFLQQKEKDLEVFDLISGKLVDIWTKFYLESL